MSDVIKFIIRARKPDGQWEVFEGGITPAPDSPDLLLVIEHNDRVHTDEVADMQAAFDSIGKTVYLTTRKESNKSTEE